MGSRKKETLWPWYSETFALLQGRWCGSLGRIDGHSLTACVCTLGETDMVCSSYAPSCLVNVK
ncbi:hypothetical protein LY76DRAFT_348706 [Colletotrichum caudatum]|nr:hypothetical protein LY76DRAFT_348706 [Colletotrichum caudatum]